MTLNTDKELQAAIDELDGLIDINTPFENARFRELSDAIGEYEARTDILNRPPDGSEDAKPGSPPGPLEPSDSQVILVSERDMEVIQAALDRDDAKPNEALMRSAERYKRLIEDGQVASEGGAEQD